MIIPTESDDEKRQSISLSGDQHFEQPSAGQLSSPSSDDPPPLYTPRASPHPPQHSNPSSFAPQPQAPSHPSSSPSLSASTSHPLPAPHRTQPSPPPPNLPNPTNNIHIHRTNDPIVDSWVIDPNLSVPDFLQPSGLRAVGEGDREGETNLWVKSTNGRIRGEVWVVGREGERKRVRMVFESVNGSVGVVFHDTSSRPPTTLHTRSQNGSITLSLPRSFRGPIQIKTLNGKVRFSNGIKERLIVREEGGVVSGWMGDWRSGRGNGGGMGGGSSTVRKGSGGSSTTETSYASANSDLTKVKRSDSPAPEEGEEETDSLEVESRNGSVTIQYVDEARGWGRVETGGGRQGGGGGGGGGRWGFVGRLFGF